MIKFPPLIDKLKLYAIVPDFNWLKKLVDLDIKSIQLRVKSESLDYVIKNIEKSINYIKNSDIQFFINDYWELAIKFSAYGVHLGQEDLKNADLNKIKSANLRLGISTHNLLEFNNSLKLKPSYIACGTIFPTNTKVMKTKSLGIDQLKNFCNISQEYPIVAIGGINIYNAKDIIATGVNGIAVISAITQSVDTKTTINNFNKLWDNNYQS